jgi:hypothetical protein
MFYHNQEDHKIEHLYLESFQIEGTIQDVPQDTEREEERGRGRKRDMRQST